MKNLLLSIFLVSMVWHTAFAQANESCRTLLESYIEKMADVGLPPAGKMHFFHFTIQSFEKNTKAIQVTPTEFRMTITENFFGYTTEQISVFADQNESFFVIHPQQMILHSSSGYDPKEDSYSKMMELQKTLIQSGRTTNCEIRKKQGISFKYLKLEMMEAFKESHKIQSVEYWFTESGDRLLEATVYYMPLSNKVKQVMTYHSMSFFMDLKQPVMAKELIFTPSGQLISLFRGYRIEEQ